MPPTRVSSLQQHIDSGEFMTKQNQPIQQNSALSRRGVLRAAAWTAPAVTVAAAAPAYASSVEPLVVDPCPVSSGLVRWAVSLSYTGLTYDNRWRYGMSAGTITLRLSGTSTTNPLAAVQWTSDSAGLVAQVSNDEYYLTTPFEVRWQSAPTGWTITRVSGNKYRFRRTDAATVKTGVVATPSTREVISGQTGTVVPASPTFTATIPSTTFSNNRAMTGSVEIPVGARITHQVLSKARPECDTPVKVSEIDQALSITPRLTATFARSAAPATDEGKLTASGSTSGLL